MGRRPSLRVYGFLPLGFRLAGNSASVSPEGSETVDQEVGLTICPTQLEFLFIGVIKAIRFWVEGQKFRHKDDNKSDRLKFKRAEFRIILSQVAFRLGRERASIGLVKIIGKATLLSSPDLSKEVALLNPSRCLQRNLREYPTN